MISAILASRGRPDSLRRSVASLRELADKPDAIEVVVAFDPDDEPTGAVAEDIGALTVRAPERYGYARLYEYYRAAAEMSTGDWLLNWNDDAFMTTAGWDSQIEGLPPHIMVADLHNAFSPDLCCFPAVRREAVDALGGFCTVDNPHMDTWWQEIGRRSNTIDAIPAHVHHDRRDITGGHDDATFREGRSGWRTGEFWDREIQGQVNAAATVMAVLVDGRRP